MCISCGKSVPLDLAEVGLMTEEMLVKFESNFCKAL